MEENKYYIDIDTVIDLEEEEKRLQRRMRRKKARKRSIMALIFVLLLITLVGFTLVSMVTGKFSLASIRNAADFNFEDLIPGHTEEPEASEELEDALEDLLSQEEEVIVSDETPALVIAEAEKEYEEALENFVSAMTLEDKVSGLFIVSPETIIGQKNITLAGDGTRKALGLYAVGGIMYGKNNYKNDAQFKEMVEKTRSFERYPLLIGVTGEVNITRDKYTELGINMIMNYRTDNLDNETENSEGSEDDFYRISGEFYLPAEIKSDDADDTAVQDTSDASVDLSHLEKARNELNDLIAAGVDIIEITHHSEELLTQDSLPASRSKAFMTDLIRNEWDYKDIILLTAPMNVESVTNYYDSSEASIAAIKAGADMILLPENFIEARDGVVSAVQRGVIDEDRINHALKRIYRRRLRGLSTEEINALTESYKNNDGNKEDN